MYLSVLGKVRMVGSNPYRNEKQNNYENIEAKQLQKREKSEKV